MHAPVATDLAEEARTGGLLRFLTCGSVDDGKSTLIGRLLYDTKSIFDDELSVLARDSVRHGTIGHVIAHFPAVSIWTSRVASRDRRARRIT